MAMTRLARLPPYRSALLALALSAFLPAVVYGMCGTATENCADSIDNDCDGWVNEGCSLQGTWVEVPYVFGSRSELRSHSLSYVDGSGGAGAGNYGQLMDYRWRLATSHHALGCQYSFDYFMTEAGFDYLDLGAWSGTGFLRAEGRPLPLFWTSTVTWPSGTALPTARFVTDGTIESSGFRTLNVRCVYANDGGTPVFRALPLNTAVDGVLLHDKDDAYFQIALPAGRELFLNLDHLGPSQDFDLFVSVDGTILSPLTDCASPMAACSGSTTGEVLHLGMIGAARTIWVRVNSFHGTGRYRLFAAAPLASTDETDTPGVVEVGLDSDLFPGSVEVTRLNSALAVFMADMLAATDGQFRVGTLFNIENDALWPASSYDIWLKAGDLSPPCIPGEHIPILDYIQIPDWFWRGWTHPGCGYAASTPRQVGEVLTHEWGHFDFGLPDEYVVGSLAVNIRKCTHSLMAGPYGMTYAGSEHHYFEFCSTNDHGTSPEIDTPPAGGPAAWTTIHGRYPALSEPKVGVVTISSDFSQLVEAQSWFRTSGAVLYQWFNL